MTARFNDPELFDEFMQIIEQTYIQTYNDSDPSLGVKRELTRAYHNLKKTLNSYSNFNLAAFRASSPLEYDFQVSIKTLDNHKIPQEVKNTLKAVSKTLESDLKKPQENEVPTQNNDSTISEEIMRLKGICEMTEEKMRNLERFLDENCKQEDWEVRDRGEKMYENIFSEVF